MNLKRLKKSYMDKKLIHQNKYLNFQENGQLRLKVLLKNNLDLLTLLTRVIIMSLARDLRDEHAVHQGQAQKCFSQTRLGFF